MMRRQHSFYTFDVLTQQNRGHSFTIEVLHDSHGWLRARLYQSWDDVFCLHRWLNTDTAPEVTDGDRIFGRARRRFGMTHKCRKPHKCHVLYRSGAVIGPSRY